MKAENAKLRQMAAQLQEQLLRVNAQLAGLTMQNAELQKQVEDLKAENAKLKKQWNDAVRNGTGASGPTGGDVGTKAPSTQRSTKAADGGGKTGAGAEQDGPGVYRVSAGPGGKYTTTVRAKSREDAIASAMDSVVKQAMDRDENAEIGTLKVEKIGP